MKTKNLFILSFAFLFSINALSQKAGEANTKKESKLAQESHLNEVLAETKKVKTQIEETAKFAINNVDKKSDFYQEIFKSYVKVQSEFDEWIEFYTLEFSSSLRNKKYVMNQAKVDTLINRSLSSATLFVNQVTNQPGLSSKGLDIPSFIDAVDYVKKAYDLYKEFRDAKKEHQEMIMKDIEEKFSKYKLRSFSELAG